ncbi:DUF2520 domain-containing protein (plasmid) [Legionella sp. D16C41]|uniref:DUF2520 domain-containing protein n=1 Tax=Legionella sp. D16C41 TaxID=3402688 RepID=UPI003AF5C1AB
MRPTVFKYWGITYSISSDKKTKYHASGVIASNYLVTLCHQAQKCLEGTGIAPELAMKIVTNLMKGTVDNLATTLSTEKSLTGPIKRGDNKTILSHLSAIEDNEQLSNFYRLMGILTLDIAKHEKEKTQSISDLLEFKPENLSSTFKP